MADVYSKEKRSEIMRKIRGKWTKPEREVHNLLKSAHVRHRMHPRIPGNPDVLVKDRNLAVFLDGCFWHGCPKHYKAPKSNTGYWGPKIEANRRRDVRKRAAVRKAGYRTLRIWECEQTRERILALGQA